MPIRIQRRRIKGWRVPPNTIYVGRPTEYGNRYIVGEKIEHVDWKVHHVADAAEAKQLFGEWLEWQFKHFPSWRQSIKNNLGGYNLACWCPLISCGIYCPCHADVLLSIANDIPMGEVIRENLRWAEREEA
jgi:uncharacterized protein DUF4326